MPAVDQARNALAAARAATMQVVAECAGVTQPVDVAAAAAMGSNVASDFPTLIKNRLSAETARKYFHAKSEGKVFCLRGPAGASSAGGGSTGSKTEMVQDIERELGVDPIVIRCSDSLSMTDVLGALPEGSVVILEEFNRCPPAQMEHAFRMQQERRLSLSVACNPGYGGRIDIAPELAARCVFQDTWEYMTDPEVQFELHRGLLARAGFLQSAELAAKWGTMMTQMKLQLQHKQHFDFGLRWQMATIRQAGKLLSLDPSLDEKELLAMMILEHMRGAIGPTDTHNQTCILQLLTAMFDVAGMERSKAFTEDNRATMIASMFATGDRLDDRLVERKGAVMLVDPPYAAQALLSLEAEAQAQGAELLVLGFGPDWEARFAQGLAAAASAGRPVWLTTDMTQAELGEGHDSVMRRCECVNELVDSGRSTTSGGDVIELGPDTRVLFVAPPSAPAAMSPAQIARLGFVDATAPAAVAHNV